MYRSTIESIAPEIFKELGSLVKRKEVNFGRITVNKLRKAVSAVLGAWTEWGVYNAAFMDELEAHFEGREVKKNECNNDDKKDLCAKDSSEGKHDLSEDVEDVVIHGPRGNWRQVSDVVDESNGSNNDTDGRMETLDLATNIKDDGGPEEKTRYNLKKDGETNDGSASHDISTATSTSTTRDHVDGKDLDGEDLDGEDLDGEELDGEELDGEVLDGEALDGEDIDGEDLDDEA